MTPEEKLAEAQQLLLDVRALQTKAELVLRLHAQQSDGYLHHEAQRGFQMVKQLLREHRNRLADQLNKST